SIYPADGEPQTAIVYRGTRSTFTFQTPTVEAMLDIVGNTTGQRTITGYTVGQGPGRARSHGGPGRARSHGGPFTSGDGRVLLYPPTNAPPDMFMVLQSAVSMPPRPVGREIVGRAYQVYSNQPSSDFAGASISFQYHEIDVQLSGQPERNLTVYFWTGTTWTALHTERDLTQNFASASLPGPGLYALMSAVEIPLTGPGWNNIAYTVDETRPVADALASVAGAYTLVYGYDSEDLNDPWKLYSVNGPNWLNQLGYLEFG
ncbi:MAG: hypothetical protein KDD78_10965, partial [Caldilineaceae bacterium]|nr:hypothetical protein [Caldilineaceae bacterium]